MINWRLGLDEFLLSALREDIGAGDVTTECCVPEESMSTATLTAKAPGVVCGLGAASRIFGLFDCRVSMRVRASDGDTVKAGETLATVTGPTRSILSCERTALNLLGRLSGVATKTAQAVKSVEGTGAKIVDTRKTTPGLRALEKYAVRCGGGSNHRFGLSDGVLIKDNHIAAAGGIANAVALAKRNCPHTLKIEVEAETLPQAAEALAAGADVIMLDNMTNETMMAAVKIIGGRALTEASGNMGDRDLRKVAETGVDFISIGALTHSPKSLDISMRIVSSEFGIRSSEY